MKPTLKPQRAAFTFSELLVVIVVVFVLVSLLLPARSGSHKSTRMSCVFNLKEIGTAYRLWAGDNGGLVPPQQSVSNGGWKEFLVNANQGAICWTNYAIMANELGQTPKLVVCANDERKPAEAFTNKFDNTHVSYFIGVSANDMYPQSIAAGDRNLGPGNVPDSHYGFSPKNGTGNDVAIPIAGPVSWSLKMHSAGYPAGAGNILMGDGSAYMESSASFNKNWLRNAPPTTNWPAGHIPATPSIRLVFP
jgi:hypothetical protein